MAIAANLVTVLTAKTNGFDAGMDNAKRKLDSFRKSAASPAGGGFLDNFRSAFELGIAGAVARVGIGGATAAVEALNGNWKEAEQLIRSLPLGDTIGKFADALDGTAKAAERAAESQKYFADKLRYTEATVAATTDIRRKMQAMEASPRDAFKLSLDSTIEAMQGQAWKELRALPPGLLTQARQDERFNQIAAYEEAVMRKYDMDQLAAEKKRQEAMDRTLAAQEAQLRIREMEDGLAKDLEATAQKYQEAMARAADAGERLAPILALQKREQEVITREYAKREAMALGLKEREALRALENAPLGTAQEVDTALMRTGGGGATNLLGDIAGGIDDVRLILKDVRDKVTFNMVGAA